MVYVVERYLPGLSQSDLLRGLSRLEALEDLQAEGSAVRYLGSTIVLGDEACFCEFVGPSAAAVAEVNRRAGLSFDRIVPAVSVKTDERRNTMTVHTTFVAPARQRRRWLLVGAAVLAAGAMGAVLAFTGEIGTEQAEPSASARVSVPVSSAAQDARRVPSIMSLTPARLAAGALGSSYALPSVQRGPTLASVLAAMTPETRRYTKAIMSLTFAQLAAGAAGSP
jgi:hypothetical protein